jgi:hypothetical protein
MKLEATPVWKGEGYIVPVRRLPDAPHWNGEAMPGKTLLIVAECGLGDTIMIIRFARAARIRSGADVRVWCQHLLLPLLSYSMSDIEFFSDQEDPPSFDAVVNIWSVYGALGFGLADISGAPYLTVPETRVRYWREQIQADGLSVGIVWASGANVKCIRSVPLGLFAELAAIEGVRLFSLQKGLSDEEQRAAFPLKYPLQGAPNAIETAAVMRCMDLVMSADSMPLHLAGALGVPVWGLLRHVTDGRWGTVEVRTWWYESARLFRQQSPGDWVGVMRECVSELKKYRHEIESRRVLVQTRVGGRDCDNGVQ